MTTAFYDRIKVNVASAPGTGAITLGSALNGYQSFSQAGVTDQSVVSYVIEDGVNWEYGHGTYSANGTSLARTTIIASSLGSKEPLNVSSNAIVYTSLLAEDLPQLGGVPHGGVAGQVLTKNSPTDGDASWQTPASGSGGGSTIGSPAIEQQATQHNSNLSVSFQNTPTIGNLIVIIAMGNGYLNNVPGLASGWTRIQTATNNNWQNDIVLHEVTSQDTSTFSPYGTSSTNGNVALVAWEIAGWKASDLTGQPFNFESGPTTSENAATADITAVPASALLLGAAWAQGSNSGLSLNNSTTPDATLVGSAGGYFSVAPFHYTNGNATAEVDVTATVAGGNSSVLYFQAIGLVPSGSSGSGSGTVPALVGLSDVDDSTPPTDGQVVTWKQSETKWTFQTPTSSSGGGTGAAAATVEKPFVAPVLSEFTASLATGATLTQNSRSALVISAPAYGGDQFSIATKPVPAVGSTGWRVDTFIYFNYPPLVQYPSCGMILVRGNAAIVWGFTSGGMQYVLWNNITNGSISYDTGSNITNSGGAVSMNRSFLRAEWTGSQLNFYSSADGDAWYLCASSTFLGGEPDHVGFAIDTNIGTGPTLSVGMAHYQESTY